MLRLAADTDPAWVRAAVSRLDAVLLDHMHCEKKAAATALSLINRYPFHAELVDRMVEHAAEELDHFRQVLAICRARGLTLGRDSADPYVNRLLEHARRDEPARLLDALVVAALIEARSCERFQLLAAALPDGPERRLFEELLPTEARHYALFMDLARTYCGADAAAHRLDEYAVIEAAIVRSLPNEPRVHG
jgi:tRNA 2-(methylsulfanyl)-N6-isopentenyladenosine37 hydroxylase